VAYQAVGKIVRYAMNERIALAAVPQDVAVTTHPEFANSEVFAALQVHNATARKITIGSPGDAPMREQAASILADIAAHRSGHVDAPTLDYLYENLKREVTT
jgi:argininosuccinate lyase